MVQEVFSASPRPIRSRVILKSGGCTLKSAIPRRDQLLLWTRAAGLCSRPGCRERLELGIGEIAHIVARNHQGPRGVVPIDPADRNRSPNLILLCPKCHSLVDLFPETYTVDTLRAWKAEHEAWVESQTSSPVPEPAWTAIVHETLRATSRLDTVQALGPTRPLAGVIELRHETSLARREFRLLTTALAAVPDDRRRFAVFSTARVPLAVQLGYVLGHRSHAELFQYHRDLGQWSWPAAPAPAAPAIWTLAEGPGVDALIRVSLSATVSAALTGPAALEVDIRVPDPSVYWLRSPAQLADLSRVYAEVLAALRARAPKRIHLYYAGPAPGAVAFGRAYNPTMNPPLVVYDYRAGVYEQPLTLNRRARR